MQVGLEVLNLLLSNYQAYCKDFNKSGLIKYICSVYLLQVLNEKNLLYKGLKLIKLISNNDRTVLINREKNLSTVVYAHSRYTIIIREITEACFDTDYCKRLLGSLDVDSVFVWSFNNNFCGLATRKTIEAL